MSYRAKNNIQIENASRADSNIAAAIALVEKEEGDGDGYGNVYGDFDVLNNVFLGGDLEMAHKRNITALELVKLLKPVQKKYGICC